MNQDTNRKPLTALGIKALSVPARGQVEYRDIATPGLACRVTAGGVRSFTIHYRIKGSAPLRRDTLGKWPEMTLAQARAVATEYRAKARLGNDPRPRPTTDTTDRTFANLADEYLAHIQPVLDDAGRVTKPARKKTWAEDKRQINATLLPNWRRLSLAALKRRDIRDLVRQIAKRSPTAANRLLSLIVTMLNFAVDELEWLDINPATRLAKPAKEIARTRVLDYDELRRVWQALEAEHFMIAALIKLKMLTIQRGGEIARMRWNDIDWMQRTWKQTDNKAGRVHVVPLAPEVIRILQNLQARLAERLAAINEGRAKKNVGEGAGKWLPRTPSDLVFPADMIAHKCEPKTPIDGRLKAPMSRIRKAAGVRDFRGHDLRRTGASRLAELGVPRFVIARILNHADDSITAIYDTYSYTKEKREALEMWSRKIYEIVSADAAHAA